MAEILDEVVPSEGASRAASMSALAPARNGGTGARRSAAARTIARPAAPRRRYADYGAEYAYVWSDLRRILVVAGVLIVLLVVLSFFVQ